MDRNEAIITIAEKTEALGGRAYMVGGCVRDELMGIAPNDIDIEIHGIEPGTLKGILEETGEPLSYGSSFGIYSLKDMDLDIAMPRKEHATGRGHRDFEIDVDPYLGTYKASRRRDFTINAMMKDVLTGEITDHFGGREDLESGILRHVNDESFQEDPLRVLRCAQFASRFGFSVAPETEKLMSTMDLTALSKERIEEELKKALLKSHKPSVFFEVLRKVNGLDYWFREVSDLTGVEQDPVFHPEGDVWTHTMEVLDRGAELREKADEPYGFMLLCLTHDFGKVLTTSEEKGRIHAYGHEKEGIPLAEAFLDRIMGNRSIKEYVLNMVPLHMKPNMTAYSRSKLKVTNRMFDEAMSGNDLILFSLADRPVFAGNDEFSGDEAFLRERLSRYEDIMGRPAVMGRDLIDAGFEPGEDFSDILEYAHKLRLAGIEKPEALKQTLRYAEGLRKMPKGEYNV